MMSQRLEIEPSNGESHNVENPGITNDRQCKVNNLQKLTKTHTNGILYKCDVPGDKLDSSQQLNTQIRLTHIVCLVMD